MSKPRRILFVCLGNICRSPAAEAVFAKRATQAGLAERGVSWDSCGTGGWHIGKPADPRMRRAAESRGYALTHLARRFSREDFEKFDLILTMDEQNRREVCALAPDDSARDKVRPMASYLRRHDDAFIPDPYYEGPEAFDRVLDLLEDACGALVDELR